MRHKNNLYDKEWFRFLAGTFITFLVAAFLLISNQIVLLPSLPNWYDQQRFLMLLLLAAALLAFALWPAPRTPRLTPYLVSAAVVLSAISPLPGWAFAESALFIGLVIAAYWVCRTLRGLNQKHPSTLIYGLIVYATLISLPPLMQFGLSIISERAEFALSTLFSGFSNHRFFSQTESFVLPLMTLPAMLLDRDSRWRKLGNVAACLLWLLAFAAGTRAFYVAMVAGGAFSWVFNGEKGRNWMCWQSKFSMIGLLGYLLLFKVAPWLLNISITSDNARLNQLESALNSSGRLEMWIAGSRLITEHPLTGIGPMHFATLAAETNFSSGFAAHPHNSVIQLLVEWGIPMGVTLLCLVGIGFWRLFRTACVKNDITRVTTERHILAITLTTGFIYSLLDGSIVTPYTQVLIAFVVGWACSLLPQRHANTYVFFESKLSNPLFCIAIRITSLLAAIHLALLAIVPFNALTPHVENYISTYSSQPLWPRLWSQGLINLKDDLRYPDVLFK